MKRAAFIYAVPSEADRLVSPNVNAHLSENTPGHISEYQDSTVGIATRNGLDGPGIESQWGGEIFRTRPDRPWGLPSLLYNGYRGLSRG